MNIPKLITTPNEAGNFFFLLLLLEEDDCIIIFSLFENTITIVESCPERRKVLNSVFDSFPNIKISNNSIIDSFDISVMASSDTSAYEESFRLLKDDGYLILFSGFNDPKFNDESYNPEIVHRQEFIHFFKSKSQHPKSKIHHETPKIRHPKIQNSKISKKRNKKI